MDSPHDAFHALRPRLMAIAYRMLGSRADAEDIVQDAWLRWQATDLAAVQSTEAWLVSVTTRLCIDRLRSARALRDQYKGPWLPEPVIEPVSPERTPEQMVELAGDVSVAFLAVLERLSPEERAALLLHDVFDVDYDEIASLLERNEAACRQLVHRARTRVREERPRVTVTREAHQTLLQRFMDATRSGNRETLTALFAADARFVADGGGKVLSVLKELHGAARIVRFFEVVAHRIGPRLSYRHAIVNGEPGLLRYVDGRFDAAISLITDGDRIHACYIVRNPDKLGQIPAELLTAEEPLSP